MCLCVLSLVSKVDFGDSAHILDFRLGTTIKSPRNIGKITNCGKAVIFTNMKLFFGFILAVSALYQANGATVNVTLYYESLCIDCVNFIKLQMFPTYQAIGDALQMDFVPFGKASWTENPWSIKCQHGDRECHGNAVMACALERYKKHEMKVKFVACVMSDPTPDRAGAKCAQKLGYSYAGVDECALGQEGRNLHMKHGRRTKNFRPAITYIPTIAFNDVYNSKDQQMSMYAFKQLVCSKFPPNEKPPGCGRQGSGEEEETVPE